jgi:hypothetical protein
VRQQVVGLLERTELNGIVIDVKSDDGFIPYDTRVPMALEAGARGPVSLKNFDEFLGRLKADGYYTVARIVVFKDSVLARHRPGWAVTEGQTGALWRDRARSAWIDPFKEESWRYSLAIARVTALKGFDEIQLDYLRFPGDGRPAMRATPARVHRHRGSTRSRGFSGRRARRCGVPARRWPSTSSATRRSIRTTPMSASGSRSSRRSSTIFVP